MLWKRCPRREPAAPGLQGVRPGFLLQFVLGAGNLAYDNVEHYYWMFLLLAIALRGAGRLSLDHIVSRKIAGPGGGGTGARDSLLLR